MLQPFPICPCAGCMAEWLEWAELVRDMDNLAARDPVSHQQWLADLDHFIASDPQQQGGAS